MYILKNIDACELENGMIIAIAQTMGYEYKMPVMKRNKYLKKDMTEEEDVKFWKEQEKIRDEYNIIFKEYMDDVFKWLKENGYVEEIDDD